MSPSAARPRVVVLLATHNGREFLPQQLRSILDQQDVAVRVVACDDASTDGTGEYLAQAADADPRLTLLEPVDFASSPRNFFHLLGQVRPEPGELVALSDQDDVWHPRKLARQAAVLAAGGYDAVSSNVTTFGGGGRPVLIRKAYPQRKFDYVMESPGPGSTFLMTERLAAAVAAATATANPAAPAARVDYHDWLIYALARSRGWRWQIMDVSLVDYRQHASNTMGANAGLKAAGNRLGLVSQRWHRAQAGLILDAVLPGARADIGADLARLAPLIARTDLAARLRLAAQAGQLRRRPRDRAIIAALIAAGLW